MEKIIFGETRVILIGNACQPGMYYPKWNSRHGCIGTVITYNKAHFIIKWDNNNVIGHPCVELQMYIDKKMKSNPNFTFKREK